MPSIPFTHKSASCYVELWGDGVGYLVSLHSEHKRQGHATELMEKVVEFADLEGFPLRLVSMPFGPKPWIPRPDLVRFYEKFGFEREPSDPTIIRMFRAARENYTPLNERISKKPEHKAGSTH